MNNLNEQRKYAVGACAHACAATYHRAAERAAYRAAQFMATGNIEAARKAAGRAAQYRDRATHAAKVAARY